MVGMLSVTAFAVLCVAALARAAKAAENDGRKGDGNALVVYFSASGNTRRVGEYIAAELNAETFELTPVHPYTPDDLDYMDKKSRVCREHDDTKLRDVELKSAVAANWDSYDTVFIGYPIWWGIAAWPMDAFIRANDFSGKTVIPFCTHGGSGIGRSGELLARMAGAGNWLRGGDFRSRAKEADVRKWVKSLSL